MWGARVRIISTHNGVDNLFNQYIQDAREGRKDYSIHRITLDDAISDGLYRRICYVTGQDWSAEKEKKWRDDLYRNAPNKESADEEYGCVPKKSGGAYLSRVLIEAAMTPERDIPILRFEALTILNPGRQNCGKRKFQRGARKTGSIAGCAQHPA
jgi:phage FluMu gp28-like protein